jgi:signal recognition particle GTPase
MAFDKAIQVTGLVLTKLDGTAKGGVVAAIARQCPKPVRFIGVGEGIDDLRPFTCPRFRGRALRVITANEVTKRYPEGREALQATSASRSPPARWSS